MSPHISSDIAIGGHDRGSRRRSNIFECGPSLWIGVSVDERSIVQINEVGAVRPIYRISNRDRERDPWAVSGEKSRSTLYAPTNMTAAINDATMTG